MPRKLKSYYSSLMKGKRNLSLNLNTIKKETKAVNKTEKSVIKKTIMPIVKIESLFKKIKGAPGFACRRIKASFTIEAAVVMPIVLIVCAMMLCFFRVLQTETVIQSALNYAARETAVYAGELAGTPAEDTEVLLRLKAKGKAGKYIKDSGCNYSYIEHGLNGISFAKSDCTGDCIALNVTYHFKLPFTFFGNKRFRVTQSSLAYKWTGRQAEDSKENGTWVYITETGAAYHKEDTCSYLKLSVKSVSKAEVKDLRNKSGGKYYPCGVCKAAAQTTVYITDYGTVYHASPECRGLKRTIYHVRLESISGYHPCGKCYGSEKS